ncbi:27006_t:CDS:2, partial [Gigaspora margarita]
DAIMNNNKQSITKYQAFSAELPAHILNDPSKKLFDKNIQSTEKKRSRADIACNESTPLCKKKLDSDGFCLNLNCKKESNPENTSYNEKEVQSLKDHILVKDENVERLEKEIQTLKNEIQSLKDHILVKDENFEKLEKEIQALKNEKFGRLKEEIQLLRDDILEKNKKVEEKIKLLEDDVLIK